jgi:hypothetical protein
VAVGKLVFLPYTFFLDYILSADGGEKTACLVRIKREFA